RPVNTYGSAPLLSAPSSSYIELSLNGGMFFTRCCVVCGVHTASLETGDGLATSSLAIIAKCVTSVVSRPVTLNSCTVPPTAGAGGPAASGAAAKFPLLIAESDQRTW